VVQAWLVGNVTASMRELQAVAWRACGSTACEALRCVQAGQLWQTQCLWLEGAKAWGLAAGVADEPRHWHWGVGAVLRARARLRYPWQQ